MVRQERRAVTYQLVLRPVPRLLVSRRILDACDHVVNSRKRLRPRTLRRLTGGHVLKHSPGGRTDHKAPPNRQDVVVDHE